MTVSRIWRAFGLQPHRSDTFKLSPDPLLIEKVRDIVGLYMSPPDHALVMCVDEKALIQALDRTLGKTKEIFLREILHQNMCLRTRVTADKNRESQPRSGVRMRPLAQAGGKTGNRSPNGAKD
jgi:hypothetical protein